MKILLAILLAAGLGGGGLAVVYLLPAPALSNEELRAFGFTAFEEPRSIAPFTLADADGGTFDPARLRGRWSLVFFGYANCPDICPITLSVLGEAEALLREGEDEAFQGIFVSVDPARDTPEALARYVAAFSADFIGVTGDVAAIEAFAKSLHAGFKIAPTEDSALGYLVDHSSQVAVIDPNGRHFGFIRSPLDAQQVATLTRTLSGRG